MRSFRRRPRRPRAEVSRGLLTLALACVACGRGEALEPTSYTTEERDGVTFVTNQGPIGSREDVWEVSKRPLRKIGDLKGPLKFTFRSVAGVGLLPNDRVFVADATEHAIYLFHTSGQLLSTMRGVGLMGGAVARFDAAIPYGTDSVIVYDEGRDGRVTVLDGELGYVRSFPNPFVDGSKPFAERSSRRWFVLADGSFVVTSTPYLSAVDHGPASDSTRVLRLSADGTFVDTIGAFRTTERFVNERGRRQTILLSPAGRLAAGGSRLAWSDSGDLEFVDAAESGEPRRVVTLASRSVPVTDEIKERYEAASVAQLDPRFGYEQRRASLEASLARARYAETLPAASAEMLIDQLGYLWIGRYEIADPSEPKHWEVFDPKGVWVGSVATPPKLDVREISEDRVVGVVMDDFSVPFIQIHRLTRR